MWPDTWEPPPQSPSQSCIPPSCSQALVEGQAGEGMGLPVLVQEYVDHGGCLFKVSCGGPA